MGQSMNPEGFGMRNKILVTVLVLLAAGCGTVKTTHTMLPLAKPSVEEARSKLPGPLLQNLRGFGNNLARIVLEDYRYHSLTIVPGGDALLYRFDAVKPGLPNHAYLALVSFPSRGMKLATGVGDGTYKIGLNGLGIALVPVDEPAVVSAQSFKLTFTKTKFMEAFNPWCAVDLPNCLPKLNLFFKDPATKELQQRELAALLLGAVPKLQYTDQEL
jgi:hypothetical protein